MSNRDRLIKEVYNEAKNCFSKGIIVTREELLEAISDTIGDSHVGDHETLIHGKVEVSEKVKVQGDTMLCRELDITFSTREFRISSRNWLVPVSEFYDNGKSRKTGPSVFEYNIPLESQSEMMILIGDKKHDIPSNLEFGYSNFNTQIVSIEKQDVFVITTEYSSGKPSKKSLQNPDSHYSGRYTDPKYFYNSDPLRVPKTLYNQIYWYYPTEKVRTWFGLGSKKKRIEGTNAVIGKCYIKPQKRDDFKYKVDFNLSDAVNTFIEKSSVSFDPLRLEQLAAC